MTSAVLNSSIPNVPVKHGKVRDVYDFGEQLLFVATDRISAFDYILPTGIPGKGELLTRISRFWFERLDVEHHFLTTNLAELSLPADVAVPLQGRSMIVQKTKVIPYECVVRGYLAGSGWQEYQQNGAICGIPLPSGLQESCRLAEPIFTPATKAEEGHDLNVSFEHMQNDSQIGTDLAEQLRSLSLRIYAAGAAHARKCGIIIADTKFEFGLLDGRVILIDEVLTPDSSRFWPQETYEIGCSPPSYDKQFVRNWLLASGWDRNSTPPELPSEIVEQTAAKYAEAFSKLAGTGK
ncbi:MAG: phosphoribosylaminoimidazolesuccinocarboxamide synthase [Fuerstiella sp.]|jgi:phosphoribosylaminoimidazole-succinocarboxamide synthase|nr:phosphoribosylaminoimidazolesuccinocarboxamide synthase [Fuerstiella sp.]